MAMMRPIPGQAFGGIANEVDWDDKDAISVFTDWTRVILPPRPHPGGNLMPTRPREQHLATSDPLWPYSERGDRLRRVYLEDGERALCSMPAEPNWWEAGRNDD